MNHNDSNADERLWWMNNQPSLPSQPKHQVQPEPTSNKQRKYEIDIHEVPKKRTPSGQFRPIPPPAGLSGPPDELWLRDALPQSTINKPKKKHDNKTPRERWPIIAITALLIILALLSTRLITGNSTAYQPATTVIYAMSTSTATTIVAPTETTIPATNTSVPAPTSTPISQVAVAAAPTATPAPLINYEISVITVQCQRTDGAQCAVDPNRIILNCFGVSNNQPCAKSICETLNTQELLFNTGTSVTFNCSMYAGNPPNIIPQLVGTCFQGNDFAGTITCYSTITAAKFLGQ